MDDLIKRLRDAAIFGPIPCPVCDESADAIERLIKERGAFQDQCISLKMNMTVMREERDELVAALEWYRDNAYYPQQAERAKRAIAKVGADKMGEVVDPNCTCDEHGACAYCWNGKKHDAYSDGMTPRDDQEFLSKTDGLDGPVEGLQADQDCGIRYVE